MGQRQKPTKTLLMLDERNNVIETFSYDDTQAKEIIGTLKQVAELFSNCHAALVSELTGGV